MKSALFTNILEGKFGDTGSLPVPLETDKQAAVIPAATTAQISEQYWLKLLFKGEIVLTRQEALTILTRLDFLVRHDIPEISVGAIEPALSTEIRGLILYLRVTNHGSEYPSNVVAELCVQLLELSLATDFEPTGVRELEDKQVPIVESLGAWQFPALLKIRGGRR